MNCDKIRQHTPCHVSLYLLQGHDFVAKDIFSESDPYVIIKCGAYKFSDRDKYHLDDPNPKFNTVHKFEVDFPGAPTLELSFYDFDDLFSDELIGKTTIDLDDRFYNPEWQRMVHKPIEYRQLKCEGSGISQGSVSMWLEIEEMRLQTERKRNQKLKIVE